MSGDPAALFVEMSQAELKAKKASDLEMAERELISWGLHWESSTKRLLKLKLERIEAGDSATYADIFSSLEIQIQHRLARMADAAAKIRKIRRMD